MWKKQLKVRAGAAKDLTKDAAKHFIRKRVARGKRGARIVGKGDDIFTKFYTMIDLALIFLISPLLISSILRSRASTHVGLPYVLRLETDRNCIFHFRPKTKLAPKLTFWLGRKRKRKRNCIASFGRKRKRKRN